MRRNCPRNEDDCELRRMIVKVQGVQIRKQELLYELKKIGPVKKLKIVKKKLGNSYYKAFTFRTKFNFVNAFLYSTVRISGIPLEFEKSFEETPVQSKRVTEKSLYVSTLSLGPLNRNDLISTFNSLGQLRSIRFEIVSISMGTHNFFVECGSIQFISPSIGKMLVKLGKVFRTSPTQTTYHCFSSIRPLRKSLETSMNFDYLPGPYAENNSFSDELQRVHKINESVLSNIIYHSKRNSNWNKKSNLKHTRCIINNSNKNN